MNYLPSDITSKALRSTYYKVQNILADRYERDLKNTDDKETRRKIKNRFNEDLSKTIKYYVEMCK